MGANNLTLFNPNASNILTDANLQIDTNWNTAGIATGEVAYSNRLNTLLRQMSTVTFSMAGLIATHLDKTIGSYTVGGAEPVTETLIKNTIDKLVLDLAVNRNTTRTTNHIWAGPASGAAAAPTFRALVANDIPNLDTAKITTGTFATARIADNAVTTVKITDLNITTAKIANANVTTAKIADLNITTDKLATAAVTTAKIADANILADKIASNAITTIKINDSAITTAKIANTNVTLAKLNADIYSGGFILDTLISPKHRSSRGYTVTGTTTLVETEISHVILTQVQYDAITKQANTIYTIVG